MYGSGDAEMIGQLPDGSGWSASSQPSCVEPLRPECPSCRQIFACGVLVHEVDDAAPRVALRFVPEARAAGRDAPVRRDARHFTDHETGAAGRARAVVHEMPIVRHAVDRRVLRHRRHHDAIDELQVAQLERQEHRRAAAIRDTCTLREATLDVADERRVAQFEIVVTDTLAAGQQAVRELQRLEMRVARDVLEPLHAIARGALQFERFELALLLIALQRAAHVAAARDLAAQRNRIFHRELRTRADREVRGVRGVADQYDVAREPAPAQHAVEVEPGGAAQVPRVAQQPRAAEILAEQLLGEGDRFVGRRAVQAVREPGFLARLHDHRRKLGAELIRVDLKPAVLGRARMRT